MMVQTPEQQVAALPNGAAAADMETVNDAAGINGNDTPPPPLATTTTATNKEDKLELEYKNNKKDKDVMMMDEQEARDELAKRASLVDKDDEVRYAQADGAYLEQVDVVAMADEDSDGTAAATAMTSETESGSESLTKVMAEMTKPRPYALFLLEKAAEIAELTFKDWKKKNLNLFGQQDEDEESSTSSTVVNGNADKKKKERIVVLGTGWAAMSFLKEIDSDLADVTVISPRNHFVFTPMLAGASVGTVEFRSICEPIREINRQANYLEATATHVDTSERTIQCQSVVCDGNSCEIDEFDVPYDKLVVTVGAQTNTFGIPGVRERCCFLKNVDDACRIRTAIINCFERANLPGLDDEEKERNLTFAVIGAGPTGIEFAAELRDFVEQDGPKYYPNLLKFVRIKVIEASSTVLAPFDKTLQEEAIQQLNRDVQIQMDSNNDEDHDRFRLTELLLDASVKEVEEKVIVLNDGKKIPYGMAVWAAGNGPLPFTLDLIKNLGNDQQKEQEVARGRLAVDPWMRVVGSEGTVLAFGDCSCITQGGQQLPATAQVAAQQGEYLAGLMNKKFNLTPTKIKSNKEGIIFPPPERVPDVTKSTLSDAIASFAMNNNDDHAKPFQFLNLGILAYTGGGSALAQVTPAPDAPPIKGKGVFGNAVWRSVYLSKQVSWRNRLLVLNDWTKRQIFGRDVTRL